MLLLKSCQDIQLGHRFDVQVQKKLRQHSSQQIIDWDFISLGFLVYVDAVCRL